MTQILGQPCEFLVEGAWPLPAVTAFDRSPRAVELFGRRFGYFVTGESLNAISTLSGVFVRLEPVRAAAPQRKSDDTAAGSLEGKTHRAGPEYGPTVRL